MALSATASLSVVSAVRFCLCMTECLVISGSLTRSNLFYAIDSNKSLSSVFYLLCSNCFIHLRSTFLFLECQFFLLLFHWMSITRFQPVVVHHYGSSFLNIFHQVIHVSFLSQYLVWPFSTNLIASSPGPSLLLDHTAKSSLLIGIHALPQFLCSMPLLDSAVPNIF